MTNKDLFLYIKNIKIWISRGLDVQYTIQTIDEEKKIYLIFQETRSSFDWTINFLFPAKVYKKYFIHRGYIKAWKSAKELIQDFVRKTEETGYSPVICGWSYGGAMAVLAAEEYNYQTGKKAEVITYGAPKILYFKHTKKAFSNCGIFRQYANINDIVTWCIPFPFVHHVNKIECPEFFNLRLLLHPEISHCNYDEMLLD